ncbi:Phosphate regulon sensor protein PhoR (SphS) [Alkalibacterium sp. AK22]|uniref:two-component system histidine kinase PnpS n=1 Tax=Alkalibacterium sp. AK22 TaxID=1229520 RepID=UPI00045318C7|nr:ATP-binding protein [Alkalibacterium sp. AK22]EXJ24460.1 Phosphate regulon sensor protein PhoR (SphS) [Alkalibacterium sp. AK22]
MKQLRMKILGFFTVVLVLFTLLFLYLFSTILERQAIEQQGEDLQSQLLTLSSLLDEEEFETDLEAVTQQLSQTADVIDERITFITPTGDVTYDSRAEEGRLENHLDRPEIQQILQEGVPVGTYDRTSESTGEVLYYAAVALNSEDGELIGFLRLSKNVEEMAGLTERMIQVLALFMMISILVALLFTNYWTKKISDPIEKMKELTEKLSVQHYSSRYNGSSYREIDDLGQSINLLAINLDQQMQEINENQTRLRELINHLIIGVMVVDSEGHITMVNPVMNEVLGEDLYGKIGERFDEALHSTTLVEMIRQAMSEQTIQNQEAELLYPEEKIVDANVVPVFNQQKETFNHIVLLYDITEIRRLEKVRTDFVANVSHELRTPITAVKGFAETLLDGALQGEAVLVEFLEIIYKESTRLDLMVQDILQLSKLEKHKASTVIQRVKARDVVEEVMKIVHQKTDLKQISVDLIEPVPVELDIDRDQLKQITLNLVGNAIAYTPEGGDITVTLSKTDKEAILSVADNGVGIPKESQARVFERFYRVDKARSRNAGGTGLGLAIVKWLVENNDGQISLESEEHKGSTFTVWLPLTKEA